LNLLNYVKDGARRKSLVADQLETIIAGAKAEIARLTDEINRAQKERDGLGLPAFDSTTNSLSVRLNDLNQKIRTVGAQITPE
jgi:hypothetical protein